MAIWFVDDRQDIRDLPQGTADNVNWNDVADEGDQLTFNWDVFERRLSTQEFMEINPFVDLIRLTQKSTGAHNWRGSFNNQDALICTRDASQRQTHLGLSLHKPAYGIGAQIERDVRQGQPRDFIACAVVLGYRQNQLGILPEKFAVSYQMNVPRSAQFMGFTSDEGDIRRLELWATDLNGVPVEFAINQVEIRFTYAGLPKINIA